MPVAKSIRKCAASALYQMGNRAASSYIVGKTTDDMVGACQKFQPGNVVFTVCPWDRAGDSPGQVLRTYHEALTAINANRLNASVSVKLPSLQYDLTLIENLIEQASCIGVPLHLDSLSPETATPTFKALEHMHALYPGNVGCTLPACWNRSIADARHMAKLGIPVRIVKGQWPDQTVPDSEINSRYASMVRILAEGSGHVGIATHDRKLLEQLIPLLQSVRCSAELEQLYGLPPHGVAIAHRHSLPIRLYIPYGTGYLPYAVEQIKKRPRILGWLLKDYLRDLLNRSIPSSGPEPTAESTWLDHPLRISP